MRYLQKRFKTAALRFRQFSRKAYAAFVSMHREVTIGRVSRIICDKELLKSGTSVAALMALCFMSAINSLAAETDSISDPPDDALQLRLQEVQVLSHQTEIHSQAYRLVTEISRAELASMPVTTIADVLQTLPGLDVRTRGVNGSQADVSMRGGTFDQVMIMLNGVNICDAQTGHYALNLPVPLSAIQRIEVLQGAVASLAGGNAFSGAINIVTINPDTTSYNVSMQAGMNMYADVEATCGWLKNDWRVTASAEYGHSNGYYAPTPSEKEQTALDNSDFNKANIFCSAAYKGLEMQIGLQYKDAGAGSFYGFGSQDQFDATRTAFGSARYEHKWGNWALDVQAAYRANYDRYEWHRGQRQYGNFHFAQNASAKVQAHYTSALGKTTFGIAARDEHIHSTNIGDTINPNGQVPNVEGFKLSDVRVLDLVKGKNRVNISWFGQQTFHVHGFSASLAASGMYNTMFGVHWTAGADLGYAFPCGVTVYANANRSLRFPTYTDLYYNAGNQLGDVNLRPEKAWTTSVGGAFNRNFGRAGLLAASADVYYRWGRDIIDWVYVAEDNKRPYHAQNQQQVNAFGVECAVTYKWNEWLRSVQVSYGYTLLDIDLVETQSRYLDYLRHKLVVRLEHGIYKGLGAAWTFSYRQRQGQFNDTDGKVQDYAPVCLLDGEVYYQFRNWRLAAECANITNRHYYDYGGILQPGAWARVRLNVRL